MFFNYFLFFVVLGIVTIVSHMINLPLSNITTRPILISIRKVLTFY